VRACREQKLNPQPAEFGPALPLGDDRKLQFDIVHDAMPEPQRPDQPVDADTREEWVISVDWNLIEAALIGAQMAALMQIRAPLLVGLALKERSLFLIEGGAEDLSESVCKALTDVACGWDPESEAQFTDKATQIFSLDAEHTAPVAYVDPKIACIDGEVVEVVFEVDNKSDKVFVEYARGVSKHC